jgi:hypothetical protein
VWGVVAAAADTFTCRVSVRTPITERDRVVRAIRQEILRRLGGVGVFEAPAAPAAASGPEGSSTEERGQH